MKEQIVTALDIGSSKLFAISGIVRETVIEVIGAEISYPTEGIVEKGCVVDMEGLSNALYDLFQSMKKQTGEKVEWVTLGLGGGHVRGTLHHQKMAIEPKGREIVESDLQILEREIRTKVLAAEGPEGRKIFEATPEEYLVDGQGQSRKSPVGRHGHTLETNMHVLTAKTNPVQDLFVCIQKVGVHVERVIPNAWAVAVATTNEEERNLGCLIMDIGKGTTDIAVYLHNALIHTESFPFGGSAIDSDICYYLHTPIAYAEELKKNYGWCTVQSMAQEKDPRLAEQVDIFTPTGRVAGQVTVEQISLIVLDRVLATYKAIKNALDPDPEAYRNLIELLAGGIILSGGSCRLKGLSQITEETFGHPTRIGTPASLPGLDRSLLKPDFAAGIGLLLSTPLAGGEPGPAWRWITRFIGNQNRSRSPETVLSRIKKKMLDIF